MTVKKIIAREWLIFLGIFILSPAPLAIYDWIVDLESEMAVIGIMRGVALTVEKPPLWEHVVSAMTKPESYLVGIMVTYPLFLFLRSIIWAIRVFIHKESI